MAFNLTTVKIPSATPGWNLDAWQYIPTGGEYPRPGPHPVIILCALFLLVTSMISVHA